MSSDAGESREKCRIYFVCTVHGLGSVQRLNVTSEFMSKGMLVILHLIFFNYYYYLTTRVLLYALHLQTAGDMVWTLGYREDHVPFTCFIFFQ